MRDLTFAHPNFAYLLPLALLIPLLYLALYRWRQQRLDALFDLPVSVRSPRREAIRTLLLTTAWVAGVCALMGPRGNVRYRDEPSSVLKEEVKEERVLSEETKEGVLRRKAHDWIFLIDASASMAVTDTRVGRSRLDLAKEILEDVVGSLEGDTVAVYAFTSQVSTVSPPTTDYLYVRLMTRRIEINEGDVAGTDLMEALEFVRKRHFKGGKKSLKTLVLLSDGGDTRIERLSGEDRAREVAAVSSRLEDAEAQNLRVFTVGLGTKTGAEVPGVSFQGQAVISTLDEGLLRELSSVGRGRYYFANDYSALAIARDILLTVNQDNVYVEQESTQVPTVQIERLVKQERERELLYDDYSRWPCLVALLALTAAFGLPLGRSICHQSPPFARIGA